MFTDFYTVTYDIIVLLKNVMGLQEHLSLEHVTPNAAFLLSTQFTCMHLKPPEIFMANRARTSRYELVTKIKVCLK